MEIEHRYKFESTFERKLRSMSRKHAAELQQLLGSSGDLRNVPAAFWEKITKERQEELQAIFVLLFILAGDQARKAKGSRSRTPRGQAEDRMRSRANTIARQHTQTSKKILQDKITKVRQQLEPGQAMDAEAIDAAVRDTFSPARDENMAITEITAIRADAAEVVINELDLKSPNDTWYTMEDERVCPICEPLHSKKRAVWAKKFPNGPPAHPRCRCWIKYDRKQKVDAE